MYTGKCYWIGKFNINYQYNMNANIRIKSYYKYIYRIIHIFIHIRYYTYKVLLGKGAKVNTATNANSSTWKGDTPLMSTSFKGIKDVVDKLVSRGAIEKSTMKNKSHAGFLAAQKRQLRSITNPCKVYKIYIKYINYIGYLYIKYY